MVKGPARVAAHGECAVLGADVSNSIVHVKSGKALPFEPGRNCRLRARLGRAGRFWLASSAAAGTSIWRDASNQVLAGLRVRAQEVPFVVMVAGESDSGKSTFCTFIANLALAEGMSLCIVDGDIGQGDLAPPAAIGAAVLRQPVVDLRDATASIFEFVGTISSAGLEHLIASRLKSICQRASGFAPMMIVNTDGYASDGGAAYKRVIADQLQPDAIVCIGENKPLAEALESGAWQLIPARSSDIAQKSRTERRWRRYDQFLRFSGDGRVKKAKESLHFTYLDTAFSVGDLGSIPFIKSAGTIEDLFVGLGIGGLTSGFGVIRRVNGRHIEIQTDLQEFDTVQLSNIRIVNRRAEQITV